MSICARDRRLRELTMIVATAVAVIMMMRMVVIVPMIMLTGAAAVVMPAVRFGMPGGRRWNDGGR